VSTLTATSRQFREAHSTNKTAGIARAIRRWMKIRRDRRLLQTLSDHLLSDIGISRSEIEYATQYGRAPR
jgi:uncharacterized protein YjiS (DUF1127 family)